MHHLPLSQPSCPTSKFEEILENLGQRIDELDRLLAQGPWKRKRHMEYFYCKKKGHVQGECCKLKNDVVQRQIVEPTLAMMSPLTAAPQDQ